MAYIYDIADTWNAIGTTFTAIKMNVTDTNSASGSLLMDLQVGGVSQFKVGKTGTLTTPGSLVASTDVYWGRFLQAVSTSSTITWGDLILARDAANTLAQRNGPGQAQAFNLYNTYSTVSDYERGFMRWSSNVLQIGTEKNGTSMVARALVFQTDGVTRMTLAIGGAATFSGIVQLSAGYLDVAAAVIYQKNRIAIDAPASGVMTISNNTQDAFGRLQFGGTTSSFPAIKRSTTSLQARLADDSAFTNIQGKLTTETAYTAGTIVATGYLTLYDSTGTAYRVPCVV